MKRIKGIFAVIVCCLMVIQGVNCKRVFAESYTGKANNDIIFLLDSSKSMLTSDPNSIRAQAVNEFLQLCHLGDKAGLIAYSDEIVRETPLADLNSLDDRQTIAGAVNGIKLGQWTDIGLALKTGNALMENGHSSMHDPIIILLSDGKNDPSRKKQESEKDIETSINTAREKGFKIYTIGLNADGTVDEDLLKRISSETSGKYFPTTTADDLKNIIFQIFAASKGSTVTPNEKFRVTGDNQILTINIPDKNVLEANIVIQSQKGIILNSIEAPSGNEMINDPSVVYTPVNNDCVLKLLNPAKGNWSIALTGSKGDIGEFNLIYDYDIAVALNLNPEKAHKGDKINLETFLSVNNNKYINKELFSILKASLTVKDTASGNIKEINIAKAQDSFKGEYTVDTTGALEFKVMVQGKNFVRESEPVGLNVENRPPVIAHSLKAVKVVKGSKDNFIDLKDAFSDPDGDTLTYKAEALDSKVLDTDTDSSKIKLSPKNKGNTTVKVTASDGKGGEVSQSFNIQVTPKVGIITILLLALLGIILLIAVIIVMRKILKKFGGSKLYGQVLIENRNNASKITNTPEVIQLPMVKKISLFQLLRLSPEFRETDNIYLTAGKLGSSLIFTNKSGCIIEEYGIGATGTNVIEINKDEKIKVVIPSIERSISIEYFY